MAAPTKPISNLPLSREKLIAYLTERIEIKKRQQHDYAKTRDYAYASREQQVIDECKKLIAVINGGEV